MPFGCVSYTDPVHFFYRDIIIVVLCFSIVLFRLKNDTSFFIAPTQPLHQHHRETSLILLQVANVCNRKTKEQRTKSRAIPYLRVTKENVEIGMKIFKFFRRNYLNGSILYRYLQNRGDSIFTFQISNSKPYYTCDSVTDRTQPTN